MRKNNEAKYILEAVSTASCVAVLYDDLRIEWPVTMTYLQIIPLESQT